MNSNQVDINEIEYEYSNANSKLEIINISVNGASISILEFVRLMCNKNTTYKHVLSNFILCDSIYWHSEKFEAIGVDYIPCAYTNDYEMIPEEDLEDLLTHSTEQDILEYYQHNNFKRCIFLTSTFRKTIMEFIFEYCSCDTFYIYGNTNIILAYNELNTFRMKFSLEAMTKKMFCHQLTTNHHNEVFENEIKFYPFDTNSEFIRNNDPYFNFSFFTIVLIGNLKKERYTKDISSKHIIGKYSYTCDYSNQINGWIN